MNLHHGEQNIGFKHVTPSLWVIIHQFLQIYCSSESKLWQCDAYPALSTLVLLWVSFKIRPSWCSLKNLCLPTTRSTVWSPAILRLEYLSEHLNNQINNDNCVEIEAVGEISAFQPQGPQFDPQLFCK